MADPSISTTSPARPSRLVFVRHGESNVTVRRVIGGPRTCSGLSPLGRRQASALHARWDRSGPEFDAVVSSGYPRAIETASIVAPALGLDTESPRIDPAWGEHDPGPDLDGMSFSDYVDRFGMPDWDGDPDVEIFPGGETMRVFHERVHTALDQLIDTQAGRSVVVFCHGGVIDAVVRRLLGVAMTGGFELPTKNTSITEFEPSAAGWWRLVRYNDAAHLDGLPPATPRTGTDGDET